MTRPKIIIDGRKDAEWLHGGRNWFVADPPPPPVPPADVIRHMTIQYWVGLLIFTTIFVTAIMVVIGLIGWVVG